MQYTLIPIKNVDLTILEQEREYAFVWDNATRGCFFFPHEAKEFSQILNKEISVLLPVLEEKTLKNEIILQRAIGLLTGVEDGLQFENANIDGARSTINKAIELLTDFNKS